MVLVDIPAVRPGRIAAQVSEDAAVEPVRELRAYLRGAVVTALPNGVRLSFEHGDLAGLAAFADVLRSLANEWAFLSIRLEVESPACRLDVTGKSLAIPFAQAIFGEVAR